MVSLDVYSAFADQQKHNLMQSARVSRDLNMVKKVFRKKDPDSFVLFTWLQWHLSPGSWRKFDKSRSVIDSSSRLTME